jgi:hypothetical protein
MARHYRIRVYGRRRKQVDPNRLAQVLILLGRHLYEKQQVKNGASRSSASPCPPELEAGDA